MKKNKMQLDKKRKIGRIENFFFSFSFPLGIEGGKRRKKKLELMRKEKQQQEEWRMCFLPRNK